MNKNRQDEEIYRDAIFNLEIELGEPISTFILPKLDWDTKYINTPIYQSILEEGVVLA